ncbi:MAG: type II toxin-antitoxin system RelE/ParE family toxin [Promethearchaeota archaeon]|nr:MAG: type II toxin-antitoxin system RelE/ParE family toxin [Candidatus Lokiarchaeota archaeon]
MVEIEWSTTAQNDLNDIIDYIAQDSLEFALSFYDQVKEKLENLTEFPNMGRKVPELDDPNIRELIFRNYRLIYRIMGDKIQIVRVFHGSRILEF